MIMTTIVQKKERVQKLNDLQISLLRLFDQKINQTHTLEVRKLLMDYFDRKLQEELNDVVIQKCYREADYRKMLDDDNFATQ
jgi:hypothetical protein